MLQSQQIGENQQYKVIVVGNTSAGKSSLVNKFVKSTFSPEHEVTIGVEYLCKKIQLENSKFIELQIWDTAGQEQFKSLVRQFYRSAAAVILVYNVANRASFDSLDLWLKEVRENSHQKIISILVGTQCDISENRQVSKQEGETWIKQRGSTLFFETSSKTGENIDQAFAELAALIDNKLETDPEYKSNVQNKTAQRNRQNSQQTRQPTRNIKNKEQSDSEINNSFTLKKSEQKGKRSDGCC